jgi:hypothetical protein
MHIVPIKMKYRVLFYIIYACVDCALRVGFLDDDVICCIVVSFCTLSLLLMYYIYLTRCAMLS